MIKERIESDNKIKNVYLRMTMNKLTWINLHVHKVLRFQDLLVCSSNASFKPLVHHINPL